MPTPAHHAIILAVGGEAVLELRHRTRHRRYQHLLAAMQVVPAVLPHRIGLVGRAHLVLRTRPQGAVAARDRDAVQRVGQPLEQGLALAVRARGVQEPSKRTRVSVAGRCLRMVGILTRASVLPRRGKDDSADSNAVSVSGRPAPRLRTTDIASHRSIATPS